MPPIKGGESGRILSACSQSIVKKAFRFLNRGVQVPVARLAWRAKRRGRGCVNSAPRRVRYPALPLKPTLKSTLKSTKLRFTTVTGSSVSRDGIFCKTTTRKSLPDSSRLLKGTFQEVGELVIIGRWRAHRRQGSCPSHRITSSSAPSLGFDSSL